MQRDWRSARVAEAFMLIQTEVGRAEVVAKQLATLPGVLSSEYVTGPYDVVVRIGAATLDDLRDGVLTSDERITLIEHPRTQWGQCRTRWRRRRG